MKTKTKVKIIVIAAVFLFIASALITSFYRAVMSYEMSVSDVSELYIMYAVNMGTSSDKSVVLPSSKDDILGGFNLLFPSGETDVVFEPADVTGFIVSKEFFNSYNPEEENGQMQKAELDNFKAAVLKMGIFAAARAATKQADGKKNNAYDAFEAFKKENGVQPNATLRVFYSNLTSVDYVPISISYEELGALFGLSKQQPEAAGAGSAVK
jgi:hypothetical protein